MSPEGWSPLLTLKHVTPQVTTISTHGYGGWGPEVWGLALGDNVVYTGGDDCLFKVWDLRLMLTLSDLLLDI